jgi:hypothetical protein
MGQTIAPIITPHDSTAFALHEALLLLQEERWRMAHRCHHPAAGEVPAFVSMGLKYPVAGKKVITTQMNLPAP